VLAISSTGQEVWSRALGRVVGSVLLAPTAAGALRAYVGTVGAAPAVSALDAQGYTVAQCRLRPDAALDASPAAVPDGAVFYVNGTQTLIALRPGAPSTCVEHNSGAGLAFPDAVVSSSGSVFFVDREPRVRRLFLGFGFIEFKQGQWPGAPERGYVSRGLTLPRHDTLVGAGALPGGGAVFQASAGNTFRFDFGFAPARIAQRGSGPVVSADGLVLLGVGDTLTAISPTSTREAPADRLANTPALGEGGRLYALAESGALSEWTYAGGTPLLRWSAQLALPGPVAFEASPALDCARSADGVALPGRPGVLYAAARAGTLYAVTVDARGLDTQAQWPKYQRDRRNSGSRDGALAADACP
jgi:outer membrane protein assembly factor BamB